MKWLPVRVFHIFLFIIPLLFYVSNCNHDQVDANMFYQYVNIYNNKETHYELSLICSVIHCVRFHLWCSSWDEGTNHLVFNQLQATQRTGFAMHVSAALSDRTFRPGFDVAIPMMPYVTGYRITDNKEKLRWVLPKIGKKTRSTSMDDKIHNGLFVFLKSFWCPKRCLTKLAYCPPSFGH